MRGFSDIWTELSSILPSPPSYRGSSWNEKPGKAGTRSGSGWLPRTWSRVQILLSCSPLARPPTHRLQVANRFFAAQEGPGGEDSSGEKKTPAGVAMKRKLLDQERGHGGGVHSYILAMTNIANSATEGMTSSEQRHPLSRLSTKRKLQPTPFIAFILCCKMCYSTKLGSWHYYHAK